MGLLVALGLLAFGAWSLFDRYSKGKGPLDLLPAGVGEPSGKPSKVTAPSTGIVYKTWTFPPNAAGQQYHVAARADGQLGWIGYWVTRATGARAFYAGWSPEQGDQVALLRQDFGV